MTENPNPERTDEFAVRLFRAHYTRTSGRETSVQTLDDLQPGMRGVWRNLALATQDVLGVEGVSHAMAAMDNAASSANRASRIRRDDVVHLRPMDAVKRAFQGGE